MAKQTIRGEIMVNQSLTKSQKISTAISIIYDSTLTPDRFPTMVDMKAYIDKIYHISNDTFYMYIYILNIRMNIIEDIGTTDIRTDDVVRYAKQCNIPITSGL